MSAQIFSLIWLCFVSTVWGAPEGRLRLQQSTYVSSSQPYFRATADQFSSSIALGAEGQWKHRKFTFNLNGRDEYSATERWNYLNVLEASVDYRPTNRATLFLGRHLETWNEWERPWQQGLFQPRYMQNKLRAESAGLSGVFVQSKAANTILTAGLFANIPDLGAHFYVRDYRFYSANPWFNPPASTFIFNSKVQDIRYSVDKPPAEEVVRRLGAAAKIEWSEGPHRWRLSYAYKPAPQFLLGFPVRNQVVIGDKADYMRVNIEPRLFYHRLSNFDYGFQQGTWTWTFSLTHERPLVAAVDDGDMAQQAGPAWIYAANLSRPLEEEGPAAARVSFGVLKVVGGDLPDRGDFAGDTSLFERRYQFNEAIMINLSKPVRGLGRFPLETQGRLIYDQMQKGIAGTFNAGMAFSRTLRADFEMDILGLLARDAKIKDNFLSAYRANDRVGMGLSYVF